MAWVVNAAAAVVRAGGADRYLYRGATLPDGVENLDHLAAIGLVVEVAELEPDPESEPEAEEPKPSTRKPSTKR